MRALLWVIGLFALAVALPVAARYFPGYVLLVLPAHRVELSLSFAALLLAAAFVLAYILLRALSLTLEMPARAKGFRREQRRLQAQRSFQQALTAFFEGRYGRAERAAREALEGGEPPALCLVIAARSAHEQKHFQSRDDYLQQLEFSAPQSSYLRLMTHAELLLEDRRYHDALQTLGKLHDKHTAALRLELRAQQQAKNWDQVLGLLPQLEKRKVLEPSLLEQVRRYAQTENIKRKAHDSKSLREYWDRLPSDLQREPRIAAAAAQGFVALGECNGAHAIVELGQRCRAPDQRKTAHSCMVLRPGQGTKGASMIARPASWSPVSRRRGSSRLTRPHNSNSKVGAGPVRSASGGSSGWCRPSPASVQRVL